MTTQLPERLQMDLRPWGITGLESLGRSDYFAAQGVLGEHHHSGQAEICYLGRGRQEFRIAGKDYIMRGGDILYSRPDEVHSSAGEPMERSLLYWLIIDLRVERHKLFDLPEEEAAALYDALKRQKTRLFRGTEQTGEILEEITRIDQNPRGQFCQTQLRLLSVRFLLEVLERATQPPTPRYSPAIAAAIQAMEQQPQNRQKLENLARTAGMSLSHFKMRFQREVGMPPGEYRIRQQITAAKRLLAEGKQSITETAYALDFSSSQYFATVFKRYTGQRPSAYQRRRSGH